MYIRFHSEVWCSFAVSSSYVCWDTTCHICPYILDLPRRHGSRGGYLDSLLETTREAVTVLCTCVHTWTQYMWQQKIYLNVCVLFQNWAHLGPKSTVPMHPKPRPFKLQLFLDFRAKIFPEWPLNFFCHHDSPSNLAECRYPPREWNSTSSTTGLLPRVLGWTSHPPLQHASNVHIYRIPASKWLESGIAPLVPRGFYPACWGEGGGWTSHPPLQHASNVHTCIYVRIYKHTRAHVYVHTYVCMCICGYIYVYVCMLYMYVETQRIEPHTANRIYICICMYVRICVHIYM